MAKATEIKIDWHNEETALDIHPNAEAPEGVSEIVRVMVSWGRTVPEKGRATWRVKVRDGDTEFVEPNVLKACNAAIKAKFGTMQHHDIKGAIEAADIKPPQLSDEEQSAAKTDWTKFEDASFLREERMAAIRAAGVFDAGETNMRKGLRDLSVHVAAVAESLENNKAFGAWVDSAVADLGDNADAADVAAAKAFQRIVGNKNAKAELLFLGRLPEAWFAMQPETTNSPKAYQLRWNNVKNDLAEQLAQAAWGKAKKMPAPGKAQSVFLTELDTLCGVDGEGKRIDDPTATQVAARAMFDHITRYVYNEDSGSLTFLDVDAEGALVHAKDKEGEYIVPTQFGTGKRAHELVLAFVKAMKAQAPAAREEKAEREADTEAANAVKPRVFAQYGVTEAAMHLARILQSHQDWGDVLDKLNGMADEADKTSWADAISNAQSAVDEEKAEEAAEDATDDADDAA